MVFLCLPVEIKVFLVENSINLYNRDNIIGLILTIICLVICIYFFSSAINTSIAIKNYQKDTRSFLSNLTCTELRQLQWYTLGVRSNVELPTKTLQFFTMINMTGSDDYVR